MPLDRRAVLRTLAASGTVAAAGCTAPLNDDETTRRPPGTGGPGTSGPDEPRGDGSTVAIEPVAEGLTSPVNLVDDPASDALYVVDQIGTIRVVGPDGLEPTPYLDYRDRVLVSPERGLLNMAFHPNYPEDDRLFLRYSAPRREGTPADWSHTEVLVEMSAPPGESTPRVDTERTLMEFPSPTIYHQAGTIVFGPDDYLYIAMGEGTRRNFAQDVTSNRLGGIHRIDVDGSTGDKPYAIPPDNPLVGTDAYPEYYAWGFRNPWRMSFNKGELIAGDVGSFRWEEIDVVEKGHNYGWPYREGPHCTGWEDSGGDGQLCGVDPSSVPGETFTDPVIAFPNSRGDNITGPRIAGTASIAGYVYERDGIVGLKDQYVFSNYTIRLADPAAYLFAADPGRANGDGEWPVTKLSVENSPNGELNRVVNSMGRDAENNVYLLTVGIPDQGNRFNYGAGEVLKIVPPGTASTTITPP